MCSRMFMIMTNPVIALNATSGLNDNRSVPWARIIATTKSRNRNEHRRNVMTVHTGDIIPASVGVRKKSCESLTSVDRYGI